MAKRMIAYEFVGTESEERDSERFSRAMSIWAEAIARIGAHVDAGRGSAPVIGDRVADSYRTL